MGLLVGIVLYPVICRTSRRKMVMWTLRIAVLPVIIVLFVLLTRNFYTSDPYAGECFCVTMSHHSHLFLQLVLVVDTFLVYPLMQITTAKGMYCLAYHCVD